MPDSVFKPSIGLEIHVQLDTVSKLFNGDMTEFGAEPNTQVGSISLAYPGTLPVLNERAVELATRMAIAVEGTIATEMSFDRKNYFYPDLPKGYQITQDRSPICIGGNIPVDGRLIALTKIHLEEDAGKSIHKEGDNFSSIDYNRAGMPLIEVVTEPVIHSSEEAGKLLSIVRKLVRYLGVSNGNMEEGSLRCDVNISLSKTETLGAKVEIKNLNSIRFVQRAIEYEIKRQSSLIDAGEQILSETRLYDSDINVTRGMRVKETLNDYRYFPDPDLPSVILSEKYIREISENLFHTPWEAEDILKARFNLPEYDVSILSGEPAIFKYFISASVHVKNYKLLSNWLMGPVKSILNERAIDIDEFAISEENLAELINKIDGEIITQNSAQKVIFPQMLEFPDKSIAEIIQESVLQDENNSESLSLVVEQVIEEFPSEFEMLKSGKNKLMGMFMGQIMKKTQGKADPNLVRELLLKKIS